MGFFQKLFAPKTLGEGLSRVKAKFNAVGENLAVRPGERLYRTPSENIVTMRSDSTGFLDINKILAPFNKAKDYLGKVAGVRRHYRAYVKKSDGKVMQYAQTYIDTFAKEGTTQYLGCIPKSEARNIGMFSEKRCDIIPNKDLAKNVVRKAKTTRARVLPYQTAEAQGLKI